MNEHIIWNQELDDALKRLIEEEGMTSKQACETMKFTFGLKFTRNSIIGRSHRLGLIFKQRPGKERTPEKPKIFKPKKIIKRIAAPPLQQIDISIDDLDYDTCRWPTGDAPPFSYCGKKIHKRAYCEEHAAISYVLPKERIR